MIIEVSTPHLGACRPPSYLRSTVCRVFTEAQLSQQNMIWYMLFCPLNWQTHIILRSALFSATRCELYGHFPYADWLYLLYCQICTFTSPRLASPISLSHQTITFEPKMSAPLFDSNCSNNYIAIHFSFSDQTSSMSNHQWINNSIFHAAQLIRRYVTAFFRIYKEYRGPCLSDIRVV